MADADLVASLAETVSALGLEKIPDKLHCNACHKFNLNAYKTTCCDTVICEPCFTSRCDISCPICDHKPFNSDVCKPNKAMRTTVKSYLKTIEKAKSEAKIAPPPAADNATEPEQTNVISNEQEDVNGSTLSVKESKTMKEDERETTPALDVQPSIEDPDQDAYEPDDDHVEIQVEAEEDPDDIPSQNKIVIEDPNEDQYDTEVERHNNNKSSFSNGQDQAATNGMDGNDFANMMNGFNNMDYNQMMQMMAANGMANFNPMMGLPMGMNTMSSGMFGGFGGPNSGMNGMNSMDMSMNFNPNQGMYSGWNNGQNNNMWQNNNANAFSNGMGGDFGSNYAFNMAQSGNFQQQYPNGDFQNGYSGRGYGRGRGRGRGGYGRGRGNFNQYSQFPQQQQQHQYSNGPNQYENQGMRSQNTNDYKNDTSANETTDTNNTSNAHEDDEFAPGGQDEIQEALGEDYQKSTTNNDRKALDPIPSTTDDTHPETGSANGTGAKEDLDGDNSMQDSTAPIPIPSIATDGPISSSDQQRPIPAAYEEDLQGPMPPPSAPLGPAAQYDYGYRARGHGRFAQRGRGLLSMQNGHSTSAVKSSQQISQPTPGVVGAPTGPRAMREPPVPARPASRPTSVGNGFQIMGRASMDSPKRPESRGFETTITVKPSAPSEHDDYRERDDSEKNSRHENYSGSKYGQDEHDSDDRSKDKDRRYRRSSKRSTYDDYDRDERQTSVGASDSADRKSSRRSRADKEPPSTSKHQSSRSKAYHEEGANGDHEMEDYEGSSRSYRDGPDGGDSRSRHRSSRTSKYDDRNRDRDRDREHDREKDRLRDRDRDRERDKDRERDRDDRHREKERDRKRSRHDRHREDDKDYDKDYDYQNDGDDHDSRHRSRRHKRDHHHRHENDDYPSTGATSTNRSHRSSAAGTPAPIASAVSNSTDKDPHTLEREARNRERMVKEQQRREKAAAKTGPGGGSGGGGGTGEHHSSRGSRRVTYKYEDDIERSLAENERSSARWR
ncbi:hypothetical protein LTR84_003125 [Exophiala bonariae]|uniref:RING-type domain-containing protein n=1 Tax=Exophiala bonariae TaxID=1690606 RepID=A0AAV9N850_9EURO|nr:hypothetical protein LTR84_003125 [Exophiala bonariae]